jgi:CRISPR/Cas system-associated exonuclease Cas4 (RecB family)
MKPKKFTAWSFSRYSEYRLCPLKAKLNHLDKIKEPPNEPMARGQRIHDQARDYLRGVLKKLPDELKLAKKWLDEVKKTAKRKIQGAIVEDDWAFTKDWNRTQWNDWDHCVLRVKLDAAHWEDKTTLVVIDWKTGKLRAELVEEYLEQLELYALAAFMIFPHCQIVKPRLAYTDLGVVHPPEPIVFKRSQVPELQKAWARRVKPMLNDTTFAPRPNDKCRFCFYGQSGKTMKGGPGLCKF